MNDDVHARRFERKARAWLEAGPDEAPRRAVAAALHEIESTPQVGRWTRGPGWSFGRTWGVPLVAGLVLAVLAGSLFALRARDSLWIGTAPATSPVSPSPDGVRSIGTRFGAEELGPGTYRYLPFEPVFSFTVPEGARLWMEPAHEDVAAFGDGRDVEDGRPVVATRTFDVVRGYRPWQDVCDPTAGPAQRSLRSVGDIVEWLHNQPGVAVGPARQVIVGGVPTTRVDVEAAEGCAATPGAVGSLPPSERTFAFAAGSRHRIWLVQLVGRPAAIDAAAPGGDAGQWLETVEQIVATMSFEAPPPG